AQKWPLGGWDIQLVLWHKKIQNEPNQPCESDCCGGDAKKPEHFGQHVRRSLSDRAKYSECGGYTGNQQQTVGRGSVAIWEVSYEPNYSGNRYPKIQARIVVEPIDKTSCVGINRAGTIGKSCERARSKSYQNSQDNFDGRVHHTFYTELLVCAQSGLRATLGLLAELPDQNT
ncbi:MAG: hypothetical protein WBX05_10260, partial [Pseudolabrys sp.]